MKKIFIQLTIILLILSFLTSCKPFTYISKDIRIKHFPEFLDKYNNVELKKGETILATNIHYLISKQDDKYIKRMFYGDVLNAYSEFSDPALAIKNGQFKYFSDKGKLIKEGRYEFNRREGEWIFYGENFSEKAFFIDGDNHRENVATYTNGNIKSRTKYKYNKKNGKMTEYYENGNLKSEMNFIDNELDGSFQLYKQDGSILCNSVYKKAKIVTTTCETIQYDAVKKYIEPENLPKFHKKDAHIFDMNRLANYVITSIKVPKDAYKYGVKGRLLVNFSVDEFGTYNGKPVKFSFTLPIRFNMVKY